MARTVWHQILANLRSYISHFSRFSCLKLSLRDSNPELDWAQMPIALFSKKLKFPFQISQEKFERWQILLWPGFMKIILL